MGRTEANYYESIYGDACSCCDDGCGHRSDAKLRARQLDKVQQRLVAMLGYGENTDLWSLLDIVAVRLGRNSP